MTVGWHITCFKIRLQGQCRQLYKVCSPLKALKHSAIALWIFFLLCTASAGEVRGEIRLQGDFLRVVSRRATSIDFALSFKNMKASRALLQRAQKNRWRTVLRIARSRRRVRVSSLTPNTRYIFSLKFFGANAAAGRSASVVVYTKPLSARPGATPTPLPKISPSAEPTASAAPTAAASPTPSATPTMGPPAAPQALTAFSLSPDQVELHWRDVSPDEDGFVVERKTDGQSYAVVAELSANQETFQDFAATGGVSYEYRVQSRNFYGSSPYCGSSRVTVLPAEPAPPVIALFPTPTATPITPAALTATMAASFLAGTAEQPEQNVTCEASAAGGREPYAYQWFIDGAPASDGALPIGMIKGANEKLLNLTNTRTGSAVISVQVIDAQGQSAVSAAATLTVGGTTPAPGPNRAVQVSAEVQSNPPLITLSWPPASAAQTYSILRRTGGAAWQSLGSVSANTFSDSSVLPQTRYEYRVSGSLGRYGYIESCIECPAQLSRGRLLLVLENDIAALGDRISRLEKDLIGDGWRIEKRFVSRQDSVLQVKSVIHEWYGADPQNSKQVFLLGHVPVPYSGILAPDGHSDHSGSWPADPFYADLDGSWTDSTVNSVSTNPRLNNVPGDGKFDQNYTPTTVELAVGRVDLYNLPAFKQSGESDLAAELRLVSNYLDKDHLYRNNLAPYDSVPDAGFDVDRFGDFGSECFVRNPFVSFPPFFGYQNIYTAGRARDLFAVLKGNPFKWVYGSGGGSYTSMSGGGSTAQFAGTPVKGIFYGFLGSYFGDWDVANNYLRAPLANQGYGLTSWWSGRPQLYPYKHGIGDSIGDAFMGLQNDRSYHAAYQAYLALHGDPTLRLYVVDPPRSLTVQVANGGKLRLSWQPGNGSAAQLFHVFRGNSFYGPFERLTPEAIDQLTFTDESVQDSGEYVYQVRATAKITSPSGSFWQTSQAAFAVLRRGSSQ